MPNMKSKVILNSAYLWKKVFIMGAIVGLFLYASKFDLDNLYNINYWLKHLFAAVFFTFSWSGIMYLIYSRYYLKRTENVIFSPEEDETISEEKIVCYGEGIWKTYFGKLYKTSDRVVFIAPKRIFTKENYFEISLGEMISQKSKNSFLGNDLIISTKNKKYRFEIFS